MRQTLARRLRKARTSRGLTQAEVGRALGLHRPTISAIEAGRRAVTSEELYRLSRLLAVPVSDLLSDAGDADRIVGPDGSSDPIDETIREMGRVIVKRFRPARIILFGSHARGTARADSDVDLLVVMDVEGSRRRTGAKIGAALHDFRIPKDIVVTTPEAFESRRDIPGTLERSAAKEGRVLHASR